MSVCGSFIWNILPWADWHGMVGMPQAARSSFCTFRKASKDGTFEAPDSLRIHKNTRIRALEIHRHGKLPRVSRRNIFCESESASHNGNWRYTPSSNCMATIQQNVSWLHRLGRYQHQFLRAKSDFPFWEHVELDRKHSPAFLIIFASSSSSSSSSSIAWPPSSSYSCFAAASAFQRLNSLNLSSSCWNVVVSVAGLSSNLNEDPLALW